jgi:minor curlin subunit
MSARTYCGFVSAVLLSTAAAYATEPSPTPVDLEPENQVFINQIGEGQNATIEQTNIYGGLLNGSIRQTGIGNNAAISLEGGDLSGSIVQSGSGNEATLEIRDEQNRGAIEQHGDGNSAGLRIDGYGKDVTLIQEGNGHAYTGPIRVGGDAPAGQMISIRQY